MLQMGRHVSAVVATIAGCSLLATALVVMNRRAHRAREVKQDLAADISVEKKKQPPKKKSVPKPKPKPRPSRSRPAPRPTFGSQLAGLGSGIPVFSAGDLAGLAGDGLAEIEATNDMVMTAETVDSQPERIPDLCPLPKPPNRAVRQAMTGFVKVRYLVNSDGRLEGIRVVEAKPEGLFEDAVVGTLERWQMKPAVYSGSPVAMSGTSVFRFQ